MNCMTFYIVNTLFLQTVIDQIFLIDKRCNNGCVVQIVVFDVINDGNGFIVGRIANFCVTVFNV